MICCLKTQLVRQSLLLDPIHDCKLRIHTVGDLAHASRSSWVNGRQGACQRCRAVVINDVQAGGSDEEDEGPDGEDAGRQARRRGGRREAMQERRQAAQQAQQARGARKEVLLDPYHALALKRLASCQYRIYALIHPLMPIAFYLIGSNRETVLLWKGTCNR